MQTLNLSINSIDFQPIGSANFSEFNDLNSITEYVDEIILGHTNSFPEASQKEQKQAQLQKHTDIKFYNAFSCYITETQSVEISSFEFPVNEKYKYLFFREINPPPPKHEGIFVIAA